MSKAGSSLLRTTLIRAADNARHQDPSSPRSTTSRWSSAARTPRRPLRGRRHLAERFWAVMNRGRPYLVCDADNTPIDPVQAQAIIAANWQVPAEVRARRRSKKREGPPDSPNRTVEATAQRESRRGDLPRPAWSRPCRKSQPKRLTDQTSIGNQGRAPSLVPGARHVGEIRQCGEPPPPRGQLEKELSPAEWCTSSRGPCRYAGR